MSETAASPVVKIPVTNVRVWTPGRDYRGDEEVWSGHVYARKAELDGNTLTSYTQQKEITHARGIGGFEPSSGLWYQTRARLETENPDVELDFIKGAVERVATLWKYTRVEAGKNWAEALVIQYPFPNEDGTDLARDEIGVPRGRQIWQMAVPARGFYLKEMPPELDMFANTLYGMPDAPRQLPNAFVYVNSDLVKPGLEISALRSYWDWSHREDRRVRVGGGWGPSGGGSDAGFRVFEGGEDSIKDVDARRRRLVVEARSMEEAERYADALRGLNVPFVEE